MTRHLPIQIFDFAEAPHGVEKASVGRRRRDVHRIRAGDDVCRRIDRLLAGVGSRVLEVDPGDAGGASRRAQDAPGEDRQGDGRVLLRISEFNQTRKPGERTLQFAEIFSQDFTDQQKAVLNQMIAEEKDVSYKSILQQIVSDRDTIQGLQEKVMHLEQSLPDSFVIAKKGDRHHDLAMNYLINDSKIDEAKAKTLLAGVDQTDELLAGNKVWFFYDSARDTFRTYVTQGEE